MHGLVDDWNITEPTLERLCATLRSLSYWLQVEQIHGNHPKTQKQNTEKIQALIEDQQRLICKFKLLQHPRNRVVYCSKEFNLETNSFETKRIE